jgi:hypothetical protein
VGRWPSGVDCSSGDAGHAFIGSLKVAKLRSVNVGLDEQICVDAFQRPDVAACPEQLTLEQFST